MLFRLCFWYLAACTMTPASTKKALEPTFSPVLFFAEREGRRNLTNERAPEGAKRGRKRARARS